MRRTQTFNVGGKVAYKAAFLPFEEAYRYAKQHARKHNVPFVVYWNSAVQAFVNVHETIWYTHANQLPECKPIIRVQPDGSAAFPPDEP